MTQFDGGVQLPIRYRGANVGSYAPMAQQDIHALLNDAPRRRRQTLFAILSELTRNAAKYGGVGGKPSEVEVDTDDDGMFVEVSSYSRLDDAEKLRALIDEHRGASNEELRKKEMQIMRASRGTSESGIGILQVLRRAKHDRFGRRLDLNLQPVNNLLRVSLRVYVE